jgi:hypothetical protein
VGEKAASIRTLWGAGKRPILRFGCNRLVNHAAGEKKGGALSEGCYFLPSRIWPCVCIRARIAWAKLMSKAGSWTSMRTMSFMISK